MQQETAPKIRIDWFKVINDLGRRGFTSQLIAESIGVARSTLLGWKQGAEPKYGDGDRLIAFWCRVMERQREALPLVRPGDWWAYHSRRRADECRETDSSFTRYSSASFPPPQPTTTETTMPPRKLTPQIPGEPIQEAEATEQTVTAADTPADPNPQPTTTETTMPASDHAKVVARRPGELPNASEIDPKTIKQPVLTQQGYVIPER